MHLLSVDGVVPQFPLLGSNANPTADRCFSPNRRMFNQAFIWTNRLIKLELVLPSCAEHLLFLAIILAVIAGAVFGAVLAESSTSLEPRLKAAVQACN